MSNTIFTAMNATDFPTLYPLWRTEGSCANTLPPVDGQRGKVFVGLTDKPRTHAAREVVVLGLTGDEVREAEKFYTSEWHPWAVMPEWLRVAVIGASPAQP